ncbi:MAG: glycosyltransferase family 39 protein [Candidatus Omnitrophota bacterium]
MPAAFLGSFGQSLYRVFSFSFSYTFYLYLLFLVFAGTALRQTRPLASHFRDLPRKYLLFLGLVLTVSFALRFLVIEHGFCVFNDELYFLNVSRNLYHNHAYGMTLSGSVTSPAEIAFYNRPGAWPFLLSLFYRLFGPSQQSAFAFSALLGSLMPALVFAASWLLFHDAKAACWASGLAALQPLYLEFSGCAASDVPTLFFMLLGLVLWLAYLKDRSKGLLYSLGMTLVWTSYMRPEYLLAVSALIVFVLKDTRMEKTAKELWLYLMTAFSLPLLVQLLPMLKAESAAAGGGFFWNPVFFLRHICGNILFFFHPFRGSSLFWFPALLGMWSCWRRQRRAFWILSALFLALILLTSAYFAADFNKGAIRYGLPASIPLLILAAQGIRYALSFLRKELRAAAALLLSLAFFFQSMADMQDWKSFRKNRFYQEISSLKDISRRYFDKILIIVADEPAAVTTLLDDRPVIKTNLFLSKEPPYPRAYFVKLGAREDPRAPDGRKALQTHYQMRVWQDIRIPPNAHFVIAEILLREKQ